MTIKPVIMAGESGTRLWPLSRRLYPKQFIKILGDLSSLQKTLVRNQPFGKPTVIVCEEHKFLAAQQIKEIGLEADLIIEPLQKGTAPCAIIGALCAKQDNLETVLLLPADHSIANEEEYLLIIDKSVNKVKEGVVTIGVKPLFAHTGYGYIKVKNFLEEKIYQAEQFVEKPDLLTAKNYIEQGNYFWNSGIFIYNCDFMLNQVKYIDSNMFEKVQESFYSARNKLGFVQLEENAYRKITANSIDYAIMENVSKMFVVEGNFGWNDLGNWNSLWQVSEKDSHNNNLTGNIITHNVVNSYVRSENKLAVLAGLDNVIVINTDDAVFIANKSKPKEVKQIVTKLSNDNRKEVTEHTQIFRPWSYYRTIDYGRLHQVKQIIVYPNHKLSTQYHYHRSEYWLVVQGTAEIIIGNKVSQLIENESIYIPKGEEHSLANIGEIDLHLVEVQSGYYLGEDDIVRLSDNYGRK